MPPVKNMLKEKFPHSQSQAVISNVYKCMDIEAVKEATDLKSTQIIVPEVTSESKRRVKLKMNPTGLNLVYPYHLQHLTM
jgi:hypothetical protein